MVSLCQDIGIVSEAVFHFCVWIPTQTCVLCTYVCCGCSANLQKRKRERVERAESRSPYAIIK